jgi:hypothetical protein
MSKMPSKDSGRFWIWSLLISVAIVLPTMGGCSANDPMILEMESAYVAADKQDGSTHVERNAAVTLVVQKYFPNGMKSEDALKRLRDLKNQGFDIGEYRHEGARNWPDGELKPYRDEATRRNLQNKYQRGTSYFFVEKQYGRHLLIVTKHAAFSFSVADETGMISDAKGSIWANGI